MRDTYVSEDTQIQVTNVYRRNKTKRDKMKRTFNFVLKGMMLSSVLVSSVIAGFGNGGIAKADGLDSQNPTDPNQTPQGVEEVQEVHQDEQARILNLKNANRVLDAAIKSGQLDQWVYERIMKSLISIDVKLDIDKKFDLSSELIDVMMKTESLLSAETAKSLGVTEATETSRSNAYSELQHVLTKLKELAPTEGGIEFNLDTGQVATQVAQPVAKVASATSIAPNSGTDKVALSSFSTDSQGNPYGIGGKGATPEQHKAAHEYLKEQREKSKISDEGIYTVDSNGNWSTKDSKSTSSPTTTKTTQQETKAVNGTIYNDFNPSQYWANDMLWLVDNGYITGYINQKHPTTGKHGTWLNPNGQLTEAQMLSVLLRYDLGLKGYAQMQKDIPNPKNNWSYNHYVTAEKIGMMTKGSSKDGSHAGKQVTRGQLAQALVSMHYGQDVTLAEAVKFMFDNKITSGTVASKGATLENFAPNTKLSRAHISTFLKNYNDVVTSGNVKDVITSGGKEPVKNTPVTPKPNDSVSGNNGKDANIYSLVPKAKKTDDVVGKKIKTKFGERAYGAKTQAQYDQTMKVVEKESKDGVLTLDGVSKFTDAEKQIVNDYFFNGKTGIKDKRDSQYRTQYNQKMLGVEDSYGAFKGKVKTVEDVQKLSSLVELFQRPTAVHADLSSYPRGINVVSAYDLVVNGQWDCTSGAYYNNAVLDQMGIDSFVLESPGRVHSFTVMKLYGEWYVYDSGFVKMSPDFILPGDNINYAPNGGLDSLPAFLQKIYRPFN